jgi:hypothetical protein
MDGHGGPLGHRARRRYSSRYVRFATDSQGLGTIYGIAQLPCDTRLCESLDPVFLWAHGETQWGVADEPNQLCGVPPCGAHLLAEPRA